MVKLTAAYSRALNSLNKEQKVAVNSVEGPVLVVAGPGTGKTQLLATRIGHILEVSDASAENVLCLTFSDSAANAMQQRLNTLIGPVANNITVSTYHSFASDLIQNYYELFKLSPDIKPTDDLTLDKIIREVLSELEYTNPLKNEVFVADIKGLISGYKRALIEPSKIIKVCQANKKFIVAANKLVNKHIPSSIRLNKQQIKNYKSLLKDSKTLPESVIENITDLKQLWLEELAHAIEKVEVTNKTVALSKWKIDWLEKDRLGNYLVKSLKVNNRQAALADIYKNYQQKLEQQRLYDYDDMILFAIKGIEANLDLKYTLQERFQYIQLDEFQDTNEAQFKLVDLLSDNPVNERRPNILAVGDDDQAIYAFQGAHYSHMQRFLDIFRDVKVVALKTNYRSTQEIIDTCSSLSGQISDRLTIASKKQKSNLNNNPLSVSRYDLELDVEHLGWTAEYIASLIQKDEKANAIAVLAPKHKYLVELIPYLHAKQIAVSYENKDDVLEDSLILQILTLARLVINLNDSRVSDALWPIVLSYPFWQLPTTLIWQLSWRANQGKQAWLKLVLNQPQTKPIGLFFLRLNQLAEHSSFESMLSCIVGQLDVELNEPTLKSYKSPFYNYYFKSLVKQANFIEPNEWRTLGHLSILRAKAKASSDLSLNLKQFIDFCEAHQKASLKISDTAPFREANEAVNLMTAFSSKGQEFSVVILLDFIDSVWGKSAGGQSSRIALPQNLAHIRLSNSNDDEKLRLLFVAMSRAKTNLTLVGFRHNLAGQNTASVSYFNETIDEKVTTSTFLPKANHTVRSPNISVIALKQPPPLWVDDHLDRFKPERRALLEDQLSSFKLSATKLNSFSDTSRGGPLTFYLEHILKFPTPASLTSQFGSVIHATLDWQFKQSIYSDKPIDLNTVIGEFERRLRLRQLDQTAFKQLFKRGQLALNAYFKQTKLIARADDLSEERLEVTLNGSRLRGEIDRLIIDKAAKSIHLIDFKTGTSYNRWGSTIKAFHHERQLYFYKLLIEQSPKFKNYTVSGATIEFVEPDPDSGEISSIDLVFNSQTSQELKVLILAVWQKIMNLDFPATDNFAPTLKGIAQFEASLIKPKV